jgi:hypothetical protein
MGCVRCPLRSLKLPVGFATARKLSVTSPEVVLPLRVFDASRTGYSVPRSPLGVTFRLALGVFRHRACHHPPKKVMHPLSGFGPSSEAPSGAAPGHHDGRTVARAFRASSHEVSCPFSGRQLGESALVRFHAERLSLPGVSHALEGLILTEPCGLVSCRCRSWGSAPSELFPAGELLRARHPAIPSRCFLLASRRGRTLRGFRRPAVRIRFRSLHPLPGPLLSWAFHRFHGFPAGRVVAVSRRCIRSWPLLRVRSRSFPKMTFSVFVPDCLAFPALAGASRPSVPGLPLPRGMRCVRCPLRSLKPTRGFSRTARKPPLASHEVVLPLRVYRRVPYRLFGSPVPPRRCLSARPRGLPASRPSPPSYEDGAPSLRLRTLFRGPIGRRPWASRRRTVA